MNKTEQKGHREEQKEQIKKKQQRKIRKKPTEQREWKGEQRKTY